MAPATLIAAAVLVAVVLSRVGAGSIIDIDPASIVRALALSSIRFPAPVVVVLFAVPAVDEVLIAEASGESLPRVAAPRLAA